MFTTVPGSASRAAGAVYSILPIASHYALDEQCTRRTGLEDTPVPICAVVESTAVVAAYEGPTRDGAGVADLSGPGRDWRGCHCRRRRRQRGRRSRRRASAVDLVDEIAGLKAVVKNRPRRTRDAAEVLTALEAVVEALTVS